MKKIYLLLSILCLSWSLSAQTIEKIYHFDNPTFEYFETYESINFDGCMQMAEEGCPVLPWYSVSLLLPQNTEAQSVEYEFSDFVEIDGKHNLYPYQMPRPLSLTQELPFVKNEIIYNSKDVYPSNFSRDVDTQYLNGYSFAFSGFTPVRYVPSTAKLTYAKTVKVIVHLSNSKMDRNNLLSGKPEVVSRVQRLAHNPENIKSYSSTVESKKQRDLDGYELLVITPEEWVSHFDEYKSFYDERAIRTKVISLEQIYSTMDGRDDQEKIRSYITQEYENEGIMMVLLGGDSKLVPFRSLYCYVSSEYVDNLPADMYYVCLDGTWDDDNDGLWGEIGEDDLLPELAIGRMPFNNEEQFNNMMHKTLEYQANPVLGEFNDIVLGAEHLGDGYYGSNDLELLIGERNNDGYQTIGIPRDYTFHRVYADGETGWSGTIFRNKINEVGGGYVHHVGHANTDYVAGWYVNTTNDNSFVNLDGVTHNYNFFHSHGCICGDFTNTCMLERLVNISTGFVAATGNSRYGWYIPWGDGPARHLHREFVDSYYNDRLQYIGTAFVEMKIMTAPNINTSWGDNGALRWNFYCINILGDVAVSPWLDEPFYPEVSRQNAIIKGSMSTDINIKKEGLPQSNFRCSLFSDDELIAFGLTNENGDATLEFEEPLNVSGPLKLVLTGPNAWCQTYEVFVIEEDDAFVYASEMTINDEQSLNANGCLDYNETVKLNVKFYNVGNVNANNVSATLSSTSEYVEVINANANIGAINSNTTISLDNAFSIKIKDNVPDGEYVFLTINCTDGTDSWSQEVALKVYAPVFETNDLDYDDSLGNNNDFIDPGETISLIFSGENIGHSTCGDVTVEAFTDNEYVTIEENSVFIEQIAVNEEFNVTLTLNVDENTPDGEFLFITVKMTFGSTEIQDDIVFTVGTVKENFETGDFSHLVWKFENDLPWTVTDTVAYEGTYCAESGHIDDDEISSLLIEIETSSDGVLSFYYKTSTELNRDFLVFYVDGELQDRWSGEIDWELVTYNIPAGSHILEWRYDKNQRNFDGADRCWIDEIIFPSNCMIVGVDVEELIKNDVNVYPNPANNYIVVESDNVQQIELYDVLGLRLMSDKVNDSRNIIDLSKLSSGVYMIRVIDSNGKDTVRRIVKQ